MVKLAVPGSLTLCQRWMPNNDLALGKTRTCVYVMLDCSYIDHVTGLHQKNSRQSEFRPMDAIQYLKSEQPMSCID